MTAQTIQKNRHPICDQAQRAQDLLLVSSFGLWAMLLGLSPVLAFRLLTAKLTARRQVLIVVNPR